MKLPAVFIVVLAACILWPADISLGVCPEDPNDKGVCDTLHVDVHSPDVFFTGPGHLVQVPIRFTHDVYDWDSVAYLYIPLCYTHTNPTKYCSLSGYWNNNSLYGEANLDRSVFRHFDGETNVIMELSERCPNLSWCLWDIDLDGVSHIGLPLNQDVFCVNCGLLGDLSRSLLATLTFRVEDTMTVCIDTCYLPSTGHLAIWTMDAVSFVPRDNMPYCFTISAPDLGDANADGIVDIGDVVYLISYLYRGGPPPTPPEVGDTNCDGIVDIGDVVRLIGYLYRGELPPSC
jgi:hypothetical protein